MYAAGLSCPQSVEATGDSCSQTAVIWEFEVQGSRAQRSCTRLPRGAGGFGIGKKWEEVRKYMQGSGWDGGAALAAGQGAAECNQLVIQD